MKNNFLNYLKNNDPEKVVSKSGIKMRKFIFPMLRLILKVTNPYKQIVVRKAEMPKKKSIIYAPTHSFKDDALNAIVLIKAIIHTVRGYLLFLQFIGWDYCVDDRQCGS